MRPSPVLESLAVPIVQAPMAGGPSTVALAVAVSDAGALGFLAAGYRSPDALRAEIEDVRAATVEPFGVNVFAPGHRPVEPGRDTGELVASYAEMLQQLARRAGVELGVPSHDDDRYEEKIDVLVDAPVAVVSFAFGCPTATVVERLHATGSEVWVTVTRATEAVEAGSVGADAVVAQGAEAGGHRGSFDDDDETPVPVLDLVGSIGAAALGMSVVAAGGLMTGAQVGATLRAGAVAAQLGTAFLLAAEAGTSDIHRAALGSDRPTVLTRAFTGRLARGMANAWTEGIGREAPSAYPEVHHLTAALRAHGRTVGDADLVNMWAGTNHALARTGPAAEIVRTLAAGLSPRGSGDRGL